MTGIQQMLLAGISTPKTLLANIQSAGASSGLVLCLDAGDLNSYTSGNQWTDVSGTAHHYQRGSLSGSDANDPTFNGVAGGLSETNYWSSDGNDYFSSVVSPTTFDDSFCQSGGAFTLAAIIRPVGSVARSLGGNGTSSGIAASGGLRVAVNNVEQFFCQYNAGFSANTVIASNLVTLSALNFVAIAFNQTAGTAVTQVGATQNTTSSLTGSDFSAPPRDWLIMHDLTTGGGMSNTDRVYGYALWNTALTTTQLSALYNSLKANRFTSLT